MALEQAILDALQDDPDTLAAVTAMDAEIDALKTEIAANGFDPVAAQAMADLTIAIGQRVGDARTAFLTAFGDWLSAYTDPT